MDKENTVNDLKAKLKTLGAKTSGTKQVLQERLKLWEENQLNRCLIPKVSPASTKTSVSTEFPPDGEFQGVTSLDNCELKNFNNYAIDWWYEKHLAKASAEKGRDLFKTKFIKRVQVCSRNSTLFFKCKCAAQTKKKQDYNVQMILSLAPGSCSITQSTCSCTAGKGSSAACKHSAALAYFLEHYSFTGVCWELVSCTSQLKTWNHPPPGRDVPTMTASEIALQHASGCSADSNPSVPQDSMMDIVPSAAATDAFVNLLINEKHPCGVLYHRTVDTTSYLQDHEYDTVSVATNICIEVNTVTKEEIKSIEKKTRLQRRSKLWKKMRRTRITASSAHSIVRTVRTGNYAEGPALKQVGLKPPPEHTPKPIQWGIEHEEVAIKEYEKAVGERVLKCGLSIDRDYNFIAASPDGICWESNTLVEIKCPYTCRLYHPSTADYLKMVRGVPTLPKEHPHYMQVQLQMHATGLNHCDYVIWTTKGIYIIPV